MRGRDKESSCAGREPSPCFMQGQRPTPCKTSLVAPCRESSPSETVGARFASQGAGFSEKQTRTKHVEVPRAFQKHPASTTKTNLKLMRHEGTCLPETLSITPSRVVGNAHPLPSGLPTDALSSIFTPRAR